MGTDKKSKENKSFRVIIRKVFKRNRDAMSIEEILECYEDAYYYVMKKHTDVKKV